MLVLVLEGPIVSPASTSGRSDEKDSCMRQLVGQMSLITYHRLFAPWWHSTNSHSAEKGVPVRSGLAVVRTGETNGGIHESPLRYTCIHRYGVREPTWEKILVNAKDPTKRKATHVDGGSTFVQLNENSDQLIGIRL